MKKKSKKWVNFEYWKEEMKFQNIDPPRKDIDYIDEELGVRLLRITNMTLKEIVEKYPLYQNEINALQKMQRGEGA